MFLSDVLELELPVYPAAPVPDRAIFLRRFMGFCYSRGLKIHLEN